MYVISIILASRAIAVNFVNLLSDEYFVLNPWFPPNRIQNLSVSVISCDLNCDVETRSDDDDDVAEWLTWRHSILPQTQHHAMRSKCRSPDLADSLLIAFMHSRLSCTRICTFTIYTVVPIARISLRALSMCIIFLKKNNACNLKILYMVSKVLAPRI